MSVVDIKSVPALSVADLEVSFRGKAGPQRVLNKISFEVNAGETVAIVGESGSGKSVTALSIMGLLPPTARVSGRVNFGGRDLLALKRTELAKIHGNEIAMIFQEPMTSLNPVMTVGRQVAESLLRHKRATPSTVGGAVRELLEKVRIPGAERRMSEYPHQFSGGMRQRVMIAMALACDPKVLIADEPTTALDVSIQAEILELIRTLQAENGLSVLFITHDMGVVAELADRTVVMYRGDIVEHNDTVSLFRDSRHPYTKALLSVVPRQGSMKASKGPEPFVIVDHETGLTQPVPILTRVIDQQAAPVLNVSGLTVRYDLRPSLLGRVTGRIHAVEDISFYVKPGETLALVGESGCGKSTTGRAILHLTTPTSGKIELDGRDLLKMPKAELHDARRDVQMIFQDPFASLNPRIKVGASIAEPLQIYRTVPAAEIEDRIASLLSSVGLDPGAANRYPHEFSGGQRQRICFARALALEPKLIIADEAVSALDVSIKAQVVNLMMELQERLGLSYLFISHDMAVVERISHRVAVMLRGEIVETGPRAAIFENPAHPYTQRLINAVPIPDPAFRGRVRAARELEGVSAARAIDFIPVRRRYLEVGPGHFVQDHDD